MMKYVLEEVAKTELQKLFGAKEQLILKYFMYKSLYSQPELVPNQKPLPIHIPKEHIEQWIVQALGVEPCGAGSYAIDVYSKKDHWGADIKMISAKVNRENELKPFTESGETSLAQKFQGTGVDLDTLFKNKQFEIIKTEWLEIYRNKFNNVFKEKNINKVFYFFIIRAGQTLFLVGLKVNLDRLDSVSIRTDSKRTQVVVLDNFIDSKLGTTRIYKAKKRLELRLFPAEWEKRGNYINFECNFSMDSVDLKRVIIDEASLYKQLSELASKIIFTPIAVQ